MKPTVTVHEQTIPALEGPNCSTPPGSVRLLATRSVGGGHKKRALAHGYSMPHPFGFSTAAGMEPYRPLRRTAFAAAQLINPPACGGCLTHLLSQISEEHFFAQGPNTHHRSLARSPVTLSSPLFCFSPKSVKEGLKSSPPIPTGRMRVARNACTGKIPIRNRGGLPPPQPRRGVIFMTAAGSAALIT